MYLAELMRCNMVTPLQQKIRRLKLEEPDLFRGRSLYSNCCGCEMFFLKKVFVCRICEKVCDAIEKTQNGEDLMAEKITGYSKRELI